MSHLTTPNHFHDFLFSSSTFPDHCCHCKQHVIFITRVSVARWVSEGWYLGSYGKEILLQECWKGKMFTQELISFLRCSLRQKFNRGLFQRLSGNEVRGIAGEKRLRCVCVFLVWYVISFRFWKTNHRSLLCSSLFQWTQDGSFTILP